MRSEITHAGQIWKIDQRRIGATESPEVEGQKVEFTFSKEPQSEWET
jgi:hypothetical protein